MPVKAFRSYLQNYQYDEWTSEADVALLRLSEAVKIGKTRIDPVDAVANIATTKKAFRGNLVCLITGWGKYIEGGK